MFYFYVDDYCDLIKESYLYSNHDKVASY